MGLRFAFSRAPKERRAAFPLGWRVFPSRRRPAGVHCQQTDIKLEFRFSETLGMFYAFTQG